MFTWVCHCRECQRATGGAGAVNLVFEKPVVTFAPREPRYHRSTGTSGQATWRGFCELCGSPLAAKADLIPHIQGISAASLDDPSQIDVIAHVWTASAPHWAGLVADRLLIERTPTAEDFARLIERAAAR